jgi:pyruvate/2-oxoglutarate dehydrogenase complex dihydrolipoamide acyltransferase (E2) component
MPLIDPSLRAGRVTSWSKQVGDDIAFGDEICVVALDDFVAIRRTARATLLAGKRRGKLKSGVEARAGKVLLTVAITSSDTGVLRKIIKDQGDKVAIGDTMAIVTTHDGDDLGREAEWADAPVMRVVANPIDGDQDFEGEY